MDLEELDELLDVNDAAIIEHINNLRTYDVKERKNHFEESTDDEFFNRFRFSKNTVAAHIIPQIENILARNHRPLYHELDVMTQTLLTLRFYATGSFYITIGDFVGIHKTTAGRVIKRVTEALVSLRQRYISLPQNEEDMRRNCTDFYQIAHFPHVLGAIDCTHIKIQSPGGNNAEFFRNRKGFFSLNVQVVSDSKNIIQDIVARWPGSAHDSHIFQNSVLRQRLEAGEWGEAVLLGDSGYPLRNYLMTPIGDAQTQAEQRYNNSHISTRTIVERTFGIWKRKFPVLSLGIRCSVPLIQQIIVATAVLHNISRQNREPDIEHLEDEIMEEILDAPGDNVNRNINPFAPNAVYIRQT